MIILGISAFYHDSAACLIRDAEIVAAAQEERFTRKKHDPSFPTNAIRYCMDEAGVSCHEIEWIVFYEKPFLKFERLLETYLAFAPKGFGSFRKSMPTWIKDKLFQKRMLREELYNVFQQNIDWSSKLLFSEHHLSHAASAFYPSPFREAAILTLDGVGEWTTSSLALGRDNKVDIIKEIHFPHSLGLLYSAFTYYTGFKVNSGEYKVMGLAPYGEPKYKQVILDNLVDVAEDGSFKLDMSYFDYATGLTMTSQKFHTLFGGAPRTPESELTQNHMDLAASVQAVTEEIVIKLARGIANQTEQKNLCLAGGVALNCVANGKLHKENIFENIWIQPAAGDAGGALGAALVGLHLHENEPRQQKKARDSMKGSYLGPEFSDDEIEQHLISEGAIYSQLADDEFIDVVAKALAQGDAIGWMQGRMEFGPRALGSRSIIADPRSPKMLIQLILKVKYRESFRPFAPSILREDVSDWFDLNCDSPYMLMVSEVKQSKRVAGSEKDDCLNGLDRLSIPRSDIPAITHVDYSARIQTVHPDTNPKYHSLLSRFKEITGCPVLVNTSFNVRGEPIVCSPKDAFRCFMGTELDILAIGSFIIRKNEQKVELNQRYEISYELD